MEVCRGSLQIPLYGVALISFLISHTYDLQEDKLIKLFVD